MSRQCSDSVPATACASTDEHLLGEIHQVLVRRVGLIELEHRELGEVGGVDALVAEVATDLEHALEAADHQPLQVELGGDAKEQVEVERVVMRHEGPCGGAPVQSAA